jgi:hypothetical protein
MTMTMTTILAKLLDFVFGCRHESVSRAFTLRGRTYKVCCECGREFDYSMKTMSVVKPAPVFVPQEAVRV